MLTDGLQLLGASTASNFTIDNGADLPLSDNNLGELFFQTGVGLHVYTENGWIQVGTPDAEQIIEALGFTPAALDLGGKLVVEQLPPLTITNTFVAANQAEMLAVNAETGDVVVRTDLRQSFILAGTDPATLADWQELLTPTAGVSSVNTQTGAVTLTTANIPESTSLYFTNARARTAISVTGGGATYDNTTGVLTVQPGGVTSVNTLTGAVTLSTSNIAEGTNQYFTNARARAAISVTGDLAYNSSTGVLSYTTPPSVTTVESIGAAGAVQLSNGSAGFTGDNDFMWNSTTNVLTLGSVATPTQIIGAPGAWLQIRGGDSTTSQGSYARIDGGVGTNGGLVFVAGGGVALATTNGKGGDAYFVGGNGKGTGNGGDVYINGGNSGGGTGSAHGTIFFKTGNANRLAIGPSGQWTLYDAAGNNPSTGSAGQVFVSGGATGPSWVATTGSGNFVRASSPTFGGTTVFPSGSTSPCITFGTDTTTGLQHATGIVGIYSAGSPRGLFTTTGVSLYGSVTTPNPPADTANNTTVATTAWVRTYVTSVTGTGTVSLGYGTVTAPSLSFTSDTSTGIYGAAGTLSITAGGVQKAVFNAAGTSLGGSLTVPGSYATPVPAAISGGDTTTITGQAKAVASPYKTTGKYYWEVTIKSGSASAAIIGIDSSNNTNPTWFAYNTTFGYGLYAGSYYTKGSSGGSYTPALALNDVIGIALDIDTRAITYYRNGVFMSTTTNIDTGIGYAPAVAVFQGAGAVTTFGVNLGQSTFKYTVPSGYLAGFLASGGAVGGVYTVVQTPAQPAITSVGTLTGLTLAADPTTAMGAATKQYVDTAASSAAAVKSVFGRTGNVVLTSSDVTSALTFTPVNATLIGANSGIATLDAAGKLTAAQTPAIAISDTFVVASEAAMLAITGADVGDVAVRTDINKTFILKTAGAATLANWQEMLTPTDSVSSVNGYVGVVSLGVADIPGAAYSGANGNITSLSGLGYGAVGTPSISFAGDTTTGLYGASGTLSITTGGTQRVVFNSSGATFTGTVAAPTPTAGDNSTKVATTAFVANAVAAGSTTSRQLFTATAGQTSFTIAGGYTAGFVDVYLNGAKQKVGSDFTASNGTTVVFASPLSVGEEVEVVAFGTFNVANTYDQATIDSKTSALSGRNRLFNPTMQIDQRQNGVVSGANGFVIDRWYAGANGGLVMSFQRVLDGPPGIPLSLKATVTTSQANLTSTSSAYIFQPLEGLDHQDLQFGTASAKNLSFTFSVKSSVTGTFTGFVRTNSQTAIRTFVFTYTINQANTWETKVISVPGDTASAIRNTNLEGLAVLFNLGCGSTNLAPSANAWNNGDFYSVAGSNNGIATTNGATFQVTGCQLEAGSATPIERRTQGQEMALCQRYYQRNDNMIIGGYSNAGQTVFVPLSFKVTMNKAPTVTFPGAAYSNATNVTTWNITQNSCVATVTVTATGYGYSQTHVVMDAELA